MSSKTKYVSGCLTAAIVLLTSIQIAHAQETSESLLNTAPPPMTLRTTETILDSFFKSESRVRETLKRYTFKRDVVLETIGPTGQVTGQYVRNSQFFFDDKGNSVERVIYRPRSTIRELRITKEDLQDLADAQLLGINVFESSKYQVTYLGQELLVGQSVFHLRVEPAVPPNPYRMRERFFRGSIWIDTVTYLVVKVSGIVEPQGKQRFPRFETWRGPVTSSLSFAARTEADDVLHFPNRSVNYRIRVRYYDYKLFASTVTVKELNENSSYMKK